MNAHRKEIQIALQKRGVLSAVELAQSLGVSRPTVTRAISSISRQRLLRIGGGRTTRYALRRQVREHGAEWPLYNVLPDGEIQIVGRLFSLAPQEWYLQQDLPWDSLRGHEFTDGLYPGLPWFLHDLRPQGFLGRAFSRRHARELGAPQDPRIWTDDDIHSALVRFGTDLPGSFVIGDNMLAAVQIRMQTPADLISFESRSSKYPALADDMINEGPAGSSAAGEQPKFTAYSNDSNGNARHVIVKFSGRTNRPEDRRWTDLLIAEDVANKALSSIGVLCAETSILQADGRTFLESVRFDREGHHGRRGLTSLYALDSAFFGAMDTPWTEAAVRLRDDNWITSEDAEHLQTTCWFGRLIGNTDMHYGNVSLFISPDRLLSLAPTYDMVPMQYRPNQEGQLPNKILNPQPPPPEARPVWARAAEAARQYWQTLADAPLLSYDFAHIAEQNAEAMSRI